MKRYLALTILAIALVYSAAQASETIKGAKKDYQVFKKDMEGQLEVADKKLEELRAKGKDKVDEAHKATVLELESTQAKLKADLEKLKADGEKASKSFKSKLAASISSLNERIQKALKN